MRYVNMTNAVIVCTAAAAGLLSGGCGQKQDQAPARSSQSGPASAGGSASAVRQDPVTSKDLNPAMSQKQKDILLARKNK